jgi:metallophosphoesterase (TIGR00282 family)
VISIIAVGDIIGRPGRRCFEQFLPRIRSEFAPDAVLINGENIAGGFGITTKIYRRYIDELNVTAITTGNHWHDKREIMHHLQDLDRLILPANMMNVENDRQGYRVLTITTGIQIAVINVIGKIFMHPDNRSPFDALDRILSQIPSHIAVRIVDFHAEATSEKQAIGQWLVGRVSLVYGTHSHVPTADHRILGGHTGFVTDLGMTGPYDSVIGMNKEASIERCRTGQKRPMEPAENDPWLPFIFVQIDEKTGKCCSIERHIWRP